MTEQKDTRNIMSHLLDEMADMLETSKKTGKIKIGLTTHGRETDIENWIKAAEITTAQSCDFEVVLIGPKQKTELLQFEALSEEQAHHKMETMLKHGIIDACITTHYTYPMGVASVGKMTTMGKGEQMYLATTSGSSAINRGVAMTLNALYGIIVAKTMGNRKPKVGILNVEGARQVEKALLQMNDRGYSIQFAKSMRSDSGCIMRGNDIIAGTPDVLVQDSLTGNITMKMCASFMSGGHVETIGAGYGPGIGEFYDQIIMVISRTSGEQVIENAIRFAAQLVRGDLITVAKREFQSARRAGLTDILDGMQMIKNNNTQEKSVITPLGEPVTHGITGIDIMDVEHAMQLLWKEEIYAESGMGCTGPVLLVSEKNLDLGIEQLKKSGYLVYQEKEC